MEFDTIVVPTPIGEFKRVFVGQRCWYPVRMAVNKARKVKWAAAYETAPTLAITHVARARSVKQNANGTYKVVFDGRVKRIRPVPFGVFAAVSAVSATRHSASCNRQSRSWTCETKATKGRK